jgi:phospho-N-acetylmuramoyl-pentapeptide-transferase
MNLLDLLKVFWISFAASAIVAWPIYRWLKSTVKQKIDPFAPESHQAKQGTPTMGGLIIVIGALAGLAVSIQLVFGGPGKGGPLQGLLANQLPGIAILLIGFAVIGFVDDYVIPKLMAGKRGLGWRQKLLLEVSVAIVGMYVVYAPLKEATPIVVGVFLVLFFSNAYNFADGLDGLAGSLWIGLSVGLLLLASTVVTSTGVQISVLAILGGIVAFLFLNAPPAKIFMGDVGSLPLGAVLGFAVTALLWPYPQIETEPIGLETGLVLPLVIWSLLMVAELVPVPMQVAYFKLTKGKRLFPATPIHHGFEKKGWPESRVMWSFALFQLLLSLAAVTVAAQNQMSTASSMRLY